MKFIIFIALCLFSTESFSQMVFAPYRSWKLQESLLGPTANGNYMAITAKKASVSGMNFNKFRQKITAELYDQNLNKIKELPLMDGKPGFNEKHASLVSLGNKLWLTYIEPTGKNAVGNITAATLDPVSLQMGTPVVIATEQEIDHQLREAVNVSFVPSPNGKKQLFFLGNSTGTFYLSCLNEEWKAEWKGKISLPGYQFADISSLLLSNDGTAYITAVDQRKKKSSIFAIKNAAIAKEQNLTTDGVVFNTIELDNTYNADQISVGGSLSKGSEYVNYVYSGTLDKNTLAVKDMVEMEIPANIMSVVDDYGLGSKGKKYGIYPTSASAKLHQMPKQKPILILEVKKTIFTERSEYGVAANLIIANFNMPAAQAFVHVPRYAVLAGSHEALEFISSTCNNKLVVGYVDNASNLGKKPEEKYTVLRGASNAGYFVLTVNEKNEPTSRLYQLSRNENSQADARKAMSTICQTY